MSNTAESAPPSGSGNPGHPDRKAGQEAIWEYFQNEAPESFGAAEPRLRFLARILTPGQRALNIGVGSGQFETIAADRGIGIHSLDPSPKAIEALRQRLGLGDRARVGYSHAIPFDENSFDAVLASEVIEHLEPSLLEKTLPEVRRVLVPGGLFLGTVPSRERLSDQMVVCPHCENRFHRWGHQQSFDPPRLSGLLSSTFTSVSVTERCFISWRHLNWKGRVGGFLKLVLSKVGVHGSNENLVFMARKA